MYYLLEDNRIIDSTNEKDISRLKWDYNCNFHNEKIYFYKPRNNYNCKEACGKKGSFCIGCKDAFKAKFNKIKNQSENVFDLIEKGDLVNTVFDLIYQVVIIAKNVVIAPQWAFDLAVVTAIYKPDSEGNYIKVWEKKENE